jgi:hypothetical protein
MFSDFFTAMRWKAASALTSTLSEGERQTLVERYVTANSLASSAAKNKQRKDEEEEDELVPKNSIAEAVAAARAQEAKLHASRWEREKEKLQEEAEAAARARVESDLALQKRRLAFELWKRQVAAATSSSEAEEGTSAAAPGAEERDRDSSETKAGATESGVGIASAPMLPPEPISAHHPILGRCLLDLGYKRIHTCSASSLANIPVWKKQRIYRHDRAKIMASDKASTMHLGLPGIIGLHEDETGQLHILDGQHRVGMFSILAEKVTKNSGAGAAANSDNIGTSNMFDHILVEVFPNSDQDKNHAQNLFLEINKAEPVKLVDMPGVSRGSDRKILTAAAEKLFETYPPMFSASQRCRPPHLNRDNLRDALFAANVLTRHGLRTAKALEEWVLEQNALLAKRYQDDAAARSAVPKSALEKAIKHKFYLGLESSWYYN